MEPLGWNSVEFNRKTNRLSDMRARKIDVHNEYMENIETTVLKKYNKLSDVPKEPADTFAARYAYKSCNHRYLSSTYISSISIVVVAALDCWNIHRRA